MPNDEDCEPQNFSGLLPITCHRSVVVQKGWVRGTPVSRAKRNALSASSLQIVKPFQLVVDRDQLSADVIGMGKSTQSVQCTFKMGFGINQKAAVGTARFVGHAWR